MLSGSLALVPNLVPRSPFLVASRLGFHSSNRHLPTLLSRQNIPICFSTTTSTSTTEDVLRSSSWDEPYSEDDEDSTTTTAASSCPLLQEHETWSRALDKAVETLRKKRRSLQMELEKAKGAEDTVARAQLIVSNLYLFSPGCSTATVQDWELGQEVELTLDPKYGSANEEADALFAQARRLKRGSTIVADLLEQTSHAWDTLTEGQQDLQSALLTCNNSTEAMEKAVDAGRLALVQDRLVRTARTTGFVIPNSKEDNSASSPRRASRHNKKPEVGSPASNIRKLKSPGGCTVLVGRNRKGNEHLSLTIARGNDIWMHSRGCPGAHVVVFNRRGGPQPTEECLQFAANLAIFYSDLRNEVKAPVSAAEPKHLLKPRGAPLGAIKVREEWRTFIGRPFDVPEALKVAREGSGQSDEYRHEDKAKRRKRTKQAAEQSKAKRNKATK